MQYQFEPMGDEHREGVVAVLNHHITSGFAAYPSQALPPQFWDMLCRARGEHPAYVVVHQDRVVGFGVLRPFLPPDTLKRTAEVSYFLLPEYTGQGVGSRLLELLAGDARDQGIDNLLAHVSSLNQGSQRFHRAHGFTEVGRFVRAGRKWDQDFDLVWFQKFI